MRLEIQQVLYFITPFFSLLGAILSLTLHLVYSSLSGSGSTQYHPSSSWPLQWHMSTWFCVLPSRPALKLSSGDQRLQAIWRKERKVGPNSKKKLSHECSALLFPFGFTGTSGFGRIEAVAAGARTCCLMQNKMMIRWAGSEANANAAG